MYDVNSQAKLICCIISFQITMDAEFERFLLQSTVKQESIDKLVKDEVSFETMAWLHVWLHVKSK